MTKAKEFRDQSDDQLNVRIEDIDSELFKLKCERAVTHKLEKPHLIKSLKKDKARILTILTERKQRGA